MSDSVAEIAARYVDLTGDDIVPLPVGEPARAQWYDAMKTIFVAIFSDPNSFRSDWGRVKIVEMIDETGLGPAFEQAFVSRFMHAHKLVLAHREAKAEAEGEAE